MYARSRAQRLGLTTFTLGLTATAALVACGSPQETSPNTGGGEGGAAPSDQPQCTSHQSTVPFEDRFGPGVITLDACPGPFKQVSFSLQRNNCDGGACPAHELELGGQGRSIGFVGLVDVLADGDAPQELGAAPPVPSPIVIPEEMRWPVLVFRTAGQVGSQGFVRSTLVLVSMRYREPRSLGFVPYSSSAPTGGGFNAISMRFEPPSRREVREGSNPEVPWVLVLVTHTLPNQGDVNYRPGAPQREEYVIGPCIHRVR